MAFSGRVGKPHRNGWGSTDTKSFWHIQHLLGIGSERLLQDLGQIDTPDLESSAGGWRTGGMPRLPVLATNKLPILNKYNEDGLRIAA
jgi:hypothetical protein